MLNDEMMIINFLYLLRNILECSDNNNNNDNNNDINNNIETKTQTEWLKIDAAFGRLLEQLEQSQFHWTLDNNTTQKGQEALKHLLKTLRPMSSRCSNFAVTLKDILGIWEEAANIFFNNVKYINDHNKDAQRKHKCCENEFVLNNTNKEWLKLFFKKHKVLSQYADPMSETRENTLNQIRKYFVGTIGKHIISQCMNMSDAKLYLINAIFYLLKETHVKYLKEFVDIWDEIDQNIGFRKSQCTRDRTILSKLAYFVVQDCTLQMTTRSYEIRQASPQPPLKQSSLENQNSKDDIKETNLVPKSPKMDENGFENSDTTGQSLIELKEWTTDDVYSTTNTRYSDNKYDGNLRRTILDCYLNIMNHKNI